MTSPSVDMPPPARRSANSTTLQDACSTAPTARVHRAAPRGLSLFVAVLSVLVLSVGLSAPAHAFEKIINWDALGDFETGVTVGPDPSSDWVRTVKSPNIINSGDMASAPSGSRALHVIDRSDVEPAYVQRQPLRVYGGLKYTVQGYAFVYSGYQTLTMTIYDASGKQLAQASAQNNKPMQLWSRTSFEIVAPPGSVSATISISAGAAETSDVWWDAIAFVSDTVVNGNFNAPVTAATGPVPRWKMISGPGATAAITTDSRAGKGAVRIVDQSAQNAVILTSEYTPVLPAVTHTLRVSVKPEVGQAYVRLNWFDVNLNKLATTDYPIYNFTKYRWANLQRLIWAPNNARFANIQLFTVKATTGTTTIDEIFLAPTPGPAIPQNSLSDVGQPLAFNNADSSGVMTLNGRPKIYTVVPGSPAHFQLADMQTGTIEADAYLPVADMGRVFSFATGTDNTVYMGGQSKSLYRWRPGDATVEPVTATTSQATMIWGLAAAPDGKIWMGTYPDGHLLSYDPTSGATVDHGVVQDGAQYAYGIAADSQFLYVTVGTANSAVVKINISDPTQKTVIPFPDGITTGLPVEIRALGDYLQVFVPTLGRRLYDLKQETWDVPANLWPPAAGLDTSGNFYYVNNGTNMPSALYSVDSTTGERSLLGAVDVEGQGDETFFLNDTTLNGVTSSWMILYTHHYGVQAVDVGTLNVLKYPITFEPNLLKIKAIGTGPGGTVVTSGFGGTSLSIMDPNTGEFTSYPPDPTDSTISGEIEGFQAQGNYLLMGGYPGGYIYRFDTTQPWVEGQNPATVTDMRAIGQDRPLAWTTVGEKSFFGTIPAYGRNGGVLGIMDTPFSQPQYHEPVPGQSIVSLTSRDYMVYGGTSQYGGAGSQPSGGTARVFAWNSNTNTKLWEWSPPEPADSFGGIVVSNDVTLLVANGNRIYEIDRWKGELVRTIVPNANLRDVGSATYQVDLEYVDGILYWAVSNRVYALEPRTLRLEEVVPTGITPRQLALSGGNLYYPLDTWVKRITLE